MACMKLGSKSNVFQRQGQAWFCTNGLPSDIIAEVGELSFYLHKFPLLSRSGVMERMIEDASEKEDEKCNIILLGIPGGANTFELVVKFCYGVKLGLTASNVVYLRCAAEHLEMTEEYGESNLVSETETFLNQVILRNWKDSLKALQTCDDDDDDDILTQADELHITNKCIETLAMKGCTCTDQNLFGWPVDEHGAHVDEHEGPMQSPGGSVLWNGISTAARPKHSSSDWWYEDVSTLSIHLFKRLITFMESRGIKQEVISGSITFYARKYLAVTDSSTHPIPMALGTPLSDYEQKRLLEEIDRLLPIQKGPTPTKFLFGLLRTALTLRASAACVSNLEKRIGMQLDEATLDDLLMSSFSNSVETLYNVECVQRILDHFLAMDRITEGTSRCSIDDVRLSGGSPPLLTPIVTVAKLIDGYLAEVAKDVNVKVPKFEALAARVPEYARPLDDGLYRAIDIYLKSHPRLSESDREQLCKLIDCQKLSFEACTHAAQNERLPLRTVIQVLFFEQLQIRTSIAGCFLVNDNLDGSTQNKSGFTGSNEGGGGDWATTTEHENQVLNVGMDSMRMRVSELEKECSNMRQEIEKLGQVKGSGTWGNLSKKLGFKMKSRMCNAHEGSVSNHNNGNGNAKLERVKDPHGKPKKGLEGSVKGFRHLGKLVEEVRFQDEVLDV